MVQQAKSSISPSLRSIVQHIQRQTQKTLRPALLSVPSLHVLVILLPWLYYLQVSAIEIPFWDYMIQSLVYSWPLMITTVLVNALRSNIHSQKVAGHIIFERDAMVLVPVTVKSTSSLHLLHHPQVLQLLHRQVLQLIHRQVLQLHHRQKLLMLHPQVLLLLHRQVRQQLHRQVRQ